jgi:flavin-binding protein dodecin
MAEPVYKLVELVGSSQDSISDAIDNAIERAATTLRHLCWFEVVQVRGAIENGTIKQYQVTLKAGFALED